MLDLFAFREFREGLAMMRDGEAEKAMALLRQASERDPENPYYLSYYGLSLAYAEGK
jgi:cytochrome c-type biogenesis protein CcmH/NrfG